MVRKSNRKKRRTSKRSSKRYTPKIKNKIRKMKKKTTKRKLIGGSKWHSSKNVKRETIQFGGMINSGVKNQGGGWGL